MRYILLLAFALMSMTSFSQIKRVSAIEVNNIPDGSGPNSKNFKKQVLGNNYLLSDSVQVENGHEEKVTLYVEVSAPKDVWDAFYKKTDSESAAVRTIILYLTVDAKYQLKNPMSFQPMKKQTVHYIDGKWRCLYKLMGRNGYGNMIEDSFLTEM